MKVIRDEDRFMAKDCDCDVNELLLVPIFPDTSKWSYIPLGTGGGLVYCDKHHGWINFQWVKLDSGDARNLNSGAVE